MKFEKSDLLKVFEGAREKEIRLAFKTIELIFRRAGILTGIRVPTGEITPPFSILKIGRLNEELLFYACPTGWVCLWHPLPRVRSPNIIHLDFAGQVTCFFFRGRKETAHSSNRKNKN